MNPYRQEELGNVALRAPTRRAAPIANLFFTSLIVACVSVGCSSKQQAVNAANTLVEVAVDACQEAPQLVPVGTPVGTVIGLICPLIGDNSRNIELLIDSLIWKTMKAEFFRKHGFLPRGMSQ